MSVEQGWVRLYRKSMGSSVWNNPNTWMVWCWCLMKVNHTKKIFPFNGKDIEVNAGQFITGINKATSELPGLTIQKYRTVIKYLEKTNRITTKSTNKFTLITVNKWTNYQRANKPLTNHQQTTNKPLTTNNNVKKDKNDNKDTIAKAIPSIKIKNEIYPMEELTYEPLEGSKPKSQYGRKTMAVLVRKYADLTDMQIKDTFDASEWSKPLGAIYRYFDKDPVKTMRYMELAVEYYRGKELDFKIHTLARSIPDTERLIKEGGGGEKDLNQLTREKYGLK